MAIPVVLRALLQIAGYVVTAYELYRTGANIYEEVNEQKKNMQKAKEEMKKIMKSLDLEISDKIDNKTEKAELKLITEKDNRSAKTVQGTGRGANVSPTIKTAIQQKIPFRPVISKVCEVADQLPLVQLRKKKGKKFSDVIPTSRMDIMIELLSMTSGEFLNATIEDFTIVRLKQLATNIMFEFMDELLGWKSPLKPEVCFGYDAKTGKYLPPLLQGTTRLQRSNSELNPFWPMPYKGKNVIGADIIIPEYRGEALTLKNIFALVEIKFAGDRIAKNQFDNYADLNKQCAKEKFGKHTTVNEGFKLSLFRYKEDASPQDEQKDEQKPQSNRNKKSS